MAFTLTEFTATRPYLYHLTSSANVARLLKTRLLQSAAELLRAAKQDDWLRQKRRDTLVIAVNGDEVHLRDQQPLYAGKTRLEDGWTFEDLVLQLNERVFFWPGWPEKSISYGERHFDRYADEKPVILRVRTDELFDANHNAGPHFCKYNSGSPRTTQGRGSPRGLSTFVSCDAATYRPSSVVEVTYRRSVTLPERIELGKSPLGPWKVAR